MSNSTLSTTGIVPAINDLAAAVAIVAVYVLRIGTIAEGRPPWVVLQVVTDAVIPLMAATWLLLIPCYRVIKSERQR